MIGNTIFQEAEIHTRMTAHYCVAVNVDKTNTHSNKWQIYQNRTYLHSWHSVLASSWNIICSMKTLYCPVKDTLSPNIAR